MKKLIMQAALALGLASGAATMAAAAPVSPAIHAVVGGGGLSLQAEPVYHRGYRHERRRHYGPRRGFYGPAYGYYRPRCRIVSRRVYSPRFGRHIIRRVEVCSPRRWR